MEYTATHHGSVDDGCTYEDYSRTICAEARPPQNFGVDHTFSSSESWVLFGQHHSVNMFKGQRQQLGPRVFVDEQISADPWLCATIRASLLTKGSTRMLG